MMWVCFDMSRSRFFFTEKCGKVEVHSQKVHQMMMRNDQSEGSLEEATQKYNYVIFFTTAGSDQALFFLEVGLRGVREVFIA